MATDRFVQWKITEDQKVQLDFILRDFFGEECLVERVKSENCCVYTISIPGKASWPFKRLDSSLVSTYNPFEEEVERWIEVFVNEDGVDVITRLMDPFTCSLAEGFTSLVARFFDVAGE